MQNMSIAGGCRCGAVRYTIEAEPLFTRHCWCRDCQYIGAGAGTVNVFFPSDMVTIEGELADYVSTADSGNRMHRSFCAKCGTPVTTQSAARLHMIGVRAGTLDDPELGKPQIAIWTSSAPSWAALEPGIPHEPRQSPPPQGPART
jgi:hypothetical protein